MFPRFAWSEVWHAAPLFSYHDFRALLITSVTGSVNNVHGLSNMAFVQFGGRIFTFIMGYFIGVCLISTKYRSRSS